MCEHRTDLEGSGNVFADLERSEPEARLAKAELAHRIATIIARAGWTQERAAARLGIDQPKVSALLRGRLSGFSTDRLLLWLTRLDQNVTIMVTPKAPTQRHGAISVHGGNDAVTLEHDRNGQSTVS